MAVQRIAERLNRAHLPGGIEPVVGPAALIEVLGWVHDVYSRTGLIGESALRLRVRPWEHDPRMATWAWRDDGGRLRGVLSLIRDGPIGLPCDHVAPDLVAALRAAGPVGCASNLCADGGLGALAKLRVIVGLVLAAYDRAARLGLKHCVAAVSPGHADMLGSLCGFVAVGGPTVYPSDPALTGGGLGAVEEDVVQVIVLEIADAAHRMRELREALWQDA